MPILFTLFKISLRQWYGLKAFTEDFNEYQSLEKLVYFQLYKEIPHLFSLF